MKYILAVSILCLLAACVGPQGPPARAPKPQQSTTSMSEAMHSKAPECMSCNADMRRRLANCGAQSGSCMSGCTGDAMKIAMCQSICQSQYASCAGPASMPNDCPAYCAL